MNTNMEHTNVQLIDLPNEVLLMIFKKLNNVELLYSLMGINTQLDRIISDSVFTKNLTLVRYFSSDLIYPLIDKILDRFCSQILPHIHSKINTLYLESLSMERILRVADYPNLHSLGLYNIDDKTAERVFSDESAQCHFYSCPYTLRYYHNITNSFQGGLFKCVCEVSLFDERPFEHEFFI
ncbi:unnamed protein product [Rotaria sp. Silwood1]|nr:unnamed protein product [Rotaria sp. Silwood1]CAF3429845.1 unnamed protein product [Rotaria sp. Silwood1]CAF4583101.1 unnamed protein product [Rotaria sp. Silwood1]CAF4696238.1 unnamed protein product [Rotaria sp. Silwood1]